MCLYDIGKPKKHNLLRMSFKKFTKKNSLHNHEVELGKSKTHRASYCQERQTGIPAQAEAASQWNPFLPGKLGSALETYWSRLRFSRDNFTYLMSIDFQTLITSVR